jgi:hypothetical protein
VPQHILPFRRLAQGVDGVGEDRPWGAFAVAEQAGAPFRRVELGVYGVGDQRSDGILAAFDEDIVEVLVGRRLGDSDQASPLTQNSDRVPQLDLGLAARGIAVAGDDYRRTLRYRGAGDC